MALTSSGQLEAEGFLCPLCMKDLVSPAQLEQHWKKAHPQEDNDVLRQLKGLFGKARKFLKIEEDGSVDGSSSNSNGGVSSLAGGAQPDGLSDRNVAVLQEPQELGQTRQHGEFFQKSRSARNDRFVMETNKLIVRLSKLIAPENTVADRAKRKEIEQRIVPWQPDEDFPLCMTCGSKFGIRRRRHHCRLCGGVMCDRCSHFLQLDFARHLTETRIVSTDAERETQQQTMVRIGGRGFLQRRGSDSSLNSYATEDGGPHVRTCSECRRLLEKRYEQNQQRQNKEVVVEIYEKMQGAMHDAARLTPEFRKMAESLSNGESTYSLDAAAGKRAEITRLYELVDNLSKRILVLDTDSDEQPCQRRLALQKSIRDAAAAHLRVHAYSLPHLPSAEEYARRRAARDADMKRRLDAEVKAAAAAAAATQAALQVQPAAARPAAKPAELSSGRGGAGGAALSRPSSAHQATTNPFAEEAVALPGPISSRRSPAGDGRGSSGRSSRGQEDAAAAVDDDGGGDPLAIQIQRVKEYLSQAEAAHMWDEVGMLRSNLSMLEQQRRQQQQQVAAASVVRR